MLTARARKALKGCSSNLHKRHRINFFGQIFPIFIRHKFLPKYTHTHTHTPSTISFSILLGFIYFIFRNATLKLALKSRNCFRDKCLIGESKRGADECLTSASLKGPCLPWAKNLNLNSISTCLLHTLTHSLHTLFTHSLHTHSLPLSHTFTPPSQSREIYACSPGKRASTTWLADGS